MSEVGGVCGEDYDGLEGVLVLLPLLLDLKVVVQFTSHKQTRNQASSHLSQI